jgi:hypothetical protein
MVGSTLDFMVTLLGYTTSSDLPPIDESCNAQEYTAIHSGYVSEINIQVSPTTSLTLSIYSSTSLISQSSSYSSINKFL